MRDRVTILLGFLRREAGLLAVIVVALVWTLNAWTPVHYGETARTLGFARAGPVAGDARPVRSDDWAVALPYFQIAVANDFGPRNEASPYKEPLKAFFALPSRDWSMAFKPSLWGFMVLDPAHAYALHFAFLAAAMVAGFALLLRQLGCSPGYALAIAATLFFSQFVQAWWTTNAATFALAPWLAVAFLWRGPWWLRAPAIAYATAAWLIGLLYPPFVISAALALGVLIVAFRPDAVRPGRIVVAMAGVAAGAGLAWAHFADLIPVMAATVYPGQRLSDGGGVQPLQLLAHVFPSLVAAGYEPLPLWQTNGCEIAVVGAYLPLAMAAFCDRRDLLAWLRGHSWAAYLWLGVLALMATWMLLPIPARFAPVLNLVPPPRMLWGFGLLLLLGPAVVGGQVRWIITAPRLAAFAAVVVAAWAVSKLGLSRTPLALGVFDIAILAILAGLLLVARFAPNVLPPRKLALTAVVLAAAATFGQFNPVQPVTQIFRPRHSEPVDALSAYAAANPLGWAVEDRHYGAILNGAGVPAINHVLLQPQLAFFRRAYPDMDPAAFDHVFNRYAHVMPAMRWAPAVIRADLIAVPPDPFAIPLPVRLDPGAAKAAPGGATEQVQTVRLGPQRWGVTLEGWGRWSGVEPGQSLRVAFAEGQPGRIVRATAVRLARPDIVAATQDRSAFAAGFGARLEIEGGPDARRFTAADFRLVAVDPKLGETAVPSLP